ncbi:Do family serine endopeptidase [Rhodobacteraceae bacterium N5(2021)]|uniref:Probable periplasmic serine endoprotease DegP-like n=1 Tax=Gymnodinialimonas phycosphaerae TaxID=2841589 RepID=A0A975TZ30_9RHOB|nr:Do family serine endopeptidase [Gymnodinialimonas phycosphaerae]
MFGALIAVVTALAVVISALPARAQNAALPGFADLVDQVGDAVVNITTSSVVAGRAGGPAPVVPEGSPLEDFFNDFLGPNGPGEDGPAPRRSQALGSGFVISEDGYLVTNNHVIEGADEIMIEFRNGTELVAELVGTDPNTDIALLRVESDEPLPFVPFGVASEHRVGDWVMVMGNPLGQGFSVSVGVVSAFGRSLSGAYDDFIQTDAAINQGNSGGPLFNLEGEVIGVNTAILSPTGGSIGIGFAMSSDVVVNVVEQLREFGETRRGWLGVRIQDVTPEMAEALGLEEARGAMVTDVPTGPALDGGIEVGDVILTFDGNEVQDTRGLVRVVGDSTVGETVRVMVFRDGGTETLRVTLGRRETAESAAVPITDAPDAAPSSVVLGMTLTPLTDQLRSELNAANVERGLVITMIDPVSDAAEMGLQVGDIITEVTQAPVGTVAELQERIETADEAGQETILLLIRRDGNPRFMALSIKD